MLLQKNEKNTISGPTFDSHKSFTLIFDIFRILLKGRWKGVARDKEGTSIYYNVLCHSVTLLLAFLSI